MNHLSEREREAVRDVITNKFGTSWTTKVIDEFVTKLAETIDRAEGYPAGSGDKYLDSKNEIVTAIVNLNSKVTNASNLGLTVEIEIESMEYNGRPGPDEVVVGLKKIYKEF